MAQHTLHFHLPGFGAVPLSVSRHRDSIWYSLVPISSTSFAQICEQLDEVDNFFISGPMKLPMMYVQSGLDIAFNARSLKSYREAMQSESEMEAFIEQTSYHYDNARNMDW